jgi:long-chain fatty acid transport protein
MAQKKYLWILIILAVLAAPRLRAQGTKNFDLSARAAALGGAFTARADDASAVYYNPAGLVFLEGIRIKTNILVGNLTATAFDPVSGLRHTSSPFQFKGSFYLTWRAAKWLGLGVGGFNPIQSSTDWPLAWPGRAVCLTDTLSSYHVRPAVAVRLTKFLSFGFGLDFVFSSVRLSQVWPYGYFGLPFENYRINYQNNFKLSGRGQGYVASLMFNFGEKLRIGARFKQKVKANIKGENWIRKWLDVFSPWGGAARFSAEDYRPIMIRPNWNMQTSAAFIIPSEMALGIMWRPLEKFILHLDLERINWSDQGNLEITIEENEELFDPEDPAYEGVIYYPYAEYTTSLKWKDVWNIKAGLEYRLSPVLALRAGYASRRGGAEADMISPASISLDSGIISLGFGYEGPLFSLWSNEKISELSFDLYVQYVMGQEQASALPGMEVVFDSDHFVFGLGVGLNIL